MLFSEKNIDPSTFFSSTSDWDWSVSEQKALKVVKLPNLNVFCLKLVTILRRKVAEFYRRMFSGGQVRVPHHINVCKISRLCIPLNLTKHSKFPNFKALFSAV